MGTRKKGSVPAAARNFKMRVDAIVSACERGERSGAECLDELHSLVCRSNVGLYRAFREESGDPLPEMVAQEVPLECPECGEVHLGEELERYWDAGGEGDCPREAAS